MRIKTACEFLQNLIGDCPFKIHRLLTDNGISFTYRLLKGKRAPKRKHSFDKVCEENGIKHKLTKFRSTWKNGVVQVEVFNRVLKEQTTNLLVKGKRAPKRMHSFDKVREEYGIKHKLTKFRGPWTNWAGGSV